MVFINYDFQRIKNLKGNKFIKIPIFFKYFLSRTSQFPFLTNGIVSIFNFTPAGENKTI